MDSLMKTKLSSATPAQLETECLVVIALDRGSKDKPEVTLETTDDTVRKASEEVIASGELTGKSCEVTLLHHPSGLRRSVFWRWEEARCRCSPDSNCAALLEPPCAL